MRTSIFLLQIILLVIITNQVQGLDKCFEYRNQQDCITSLDDQCIWENQICSYTKNLQIGCSEFLNKNACIKQLSFNSGKLAKCIFNQQCQSVLNFTLLNCQDSLSKHACMAIQKTSEMCYWDSKTFTCKYVSQNDNLNNNFADRLYSASVCGRIENYLVIHHTKLWELTQYTPDFIQETEDIHRQDLGLQPEIKDKQYDIGNIKNNYVNSQGYFQWYIQGQPLGSGLSNLKISDRKREGCIAIEIVDDNDYQMLFSSPIYEVGINHIYCRYIGAIFTRFRCLKVENELQLRDTNFLENNSIICKYLDRNRCAYVKMECIPQTLNLDGQEKEFACKDGLDASKSACLSEALDTYRKCKKLTGNDGCYLDTISKPPVCSQDCITIDEAQCDTDKCYWTEYSEGFYGCIPLLGCKQPGINYYYCLYLRLLCQWDQINQECIQLQEYQLNSMTCAEATTKFTCSSIITMGQECIWLDEEQKCLNILSDTLLKTYYSFPESYAVNRELCMNQKGNHKYVNHFCISNNTNGTCNTEDSSQFNQELCFNTIDCQWDVLNQVCKPLVLESTCDLNKNVSTNACNSFTNCKYDFVTHSCFTQISNLKCNDQGLKKEVCLGLSNQACQWKNNTCNQVTYFSSFCSSYRNVSQRVCVLQETEKCMFSSNNCLLIETAPTDCNLNLNRLACQFSTAACYFTGETCATLSAAQQLNLTCEGYYLSKSACQQIQRNDQYCYWSNDSCQNVPKNQYLSCTTGTSISKQACINIQSFFSKEPLDEFYCSYKLPDSVCVQQLKTTVISGCSNSNLLLNQQSCKLLTSGSCIFVDNQCKSQPSDYASSKYWDYQLNNIKCEQANKNICSQLKKYFCKYTSNGCITDVSNTKYRCGQYAVSTTTYNYLICSNSQYDNVSGTNLVACQLNNLKTGCQVYEGFTYFNCNELGINKKICTTLTYGQCAFTNGRCSSDLSKVTSCDQLNQWACLNSQLNCSYINMIGCQVNTATSKCDTKGNMVITSWYLCASQRKCVGYLSQCKDNQSFQLKCDSKGIGMDICNGNAVICQFLGGECKNISQTQCEYETTLDQCVNNLMYNCVYQNGVCYTQDKLLQCNIYDNTNYKFCRQYPYCQYDSKNYKCLDYTDMAKVNVFNMLYTDNCLQFLNQFDCLNQWYMKCIFQNDTCKNIVGALSSCPHQQSYSKKVCDQFSNCDFKFGYFCVDTTLTLDCSLFQQSRCLQDIDNNLACYWDGTNCQAITNQTCANVQTYQMNYAGCQKVSNQDGKKCFYQQSSQKCKVLQETNTCASFTTNIECALRANASCLLGNPTSATTTCTSSSSFNVNLNQYGCTQLTGSAYYYDIYTYTCVAMDLTKIQGCQNLNRDACTKSTSDALVIQCGWINNQCQQLRDLTNITDCTILNQYACINIEITTLTCQWNVAAKTCTSSAQTACYVPGSIPASPTTLYSLSLCSKAGNTNACQANYNNSGCITFNYQIEICSGLGLNKKACIELTTGYCKWQNNQCQNSQLDNLNCNSDVNQNTCLQINNQLCQWNNTTKVCSDKILTLCSDATNYNQCMNVPNKLCFYTDSCIELITNPKVCLKGYSKYSCRQVSDQICTFQNNICQVLAYVDNQKECSKLTTSSSCIASSFGCLWLNNECFMKLNCVKDINKLECFSDESPCLYNGCTIQSPLSCSFIYNKIACLESGYYCYWDNISGCNTFTTDQSTIDCETYSNQINRKVCEKYSTSCEYRDYQCTKILSNLFYQVQPNVVISSSPVVIQTNCSGYLTELDCVISTDLECYWNITCQSIVGQTLTCASKLNLQACNKLGCLWRQRKCIEKSTYLFQPNEVIDQDIQDCKTNYISKSTCFNISNKPCYFDTITNQCNDQEFIIQNKKCSDYKNVNQETCQQIPDQSCTYDSNTNNCIDFKGTFTNIDSLSKLACLSLTQAAYWNNGCYLVNSFQCDSAYEVTEAACKLAETSCYYNSNLKKCSSEFNVNSMLCNTPGLSLSACTSIIRQPCIFLEGQCQMISTDYICEEARQVNQLACQVQDNPCLYDTINKKCKTVTTQKTCTTTGLSKSACLLNTSCLFNDDLYECQCYLVAVKTVCAQLNQIECGSQEYCIYDTEYKKCRKERCEDLSYQDCKDQRINLACFLNNGICQSASKCEDIINVDHIICNSFKFNSNEQCIGINERCLNQKNYDLYCQLSDCSNSFCKKTNICEAKQCSELTNCSSLGDKCILSQNQCVDNISCQNLDSSQCGIVQLYNQQICQIQQQNIYEDTSICTSQVCDLFGSSDLCNGNEFNNFTCVQKDQRCLPCEYITDACTCSAATNICEWSKQKCKSISCSSFAAQDTCNTLSRCQWSNFYGQCSLHCNLIISQEDCDMRQNECYYDIANNLCQVGTYISPDLSVNIILSNTYSYILIHSLIIIIIGI